MVCLKDIVSIGLNPARCEQQIFSLIIYFIKMESMLDILINNAIMKIWKASFTFLEVIIIKNRLEELRKTRGIRQEELASALEVSRQTIGSLENGRYNPSIQLAFKIARYFGMSIEDIFIYEEDAK